MKKVKEIFEKFRVLITSPWMAAKQFKKLVDQMAEKIEAED